MRISTIAIGAAIALGVSGCGSAGSKSASLPTPPSPIVLSAAITDAHIQVSPARIGAGPVLFTVSNQSSRAASLVISPAGHSGTLARTAPINPQGAIQVKVDLPRGTYTIALAPGGATDAQRAPPHGVPGTTLHVGAERTSAAGQLLEP